LASTRTIKSNSSKKLRGMAFHGYSLAPITLQNEGNCKLTSEADRGIGRYAGCAIILDHRMTPDSAN